VVKLEVLFFGGRINHRNGPGGMKKSKSLSLRENADSTKRESAPPATPLYRPVSINASAGGRKPPRKMLIERRLHARAMICDKLLIRIYVFY